MTELEHRMLRRERLANERRLKRREDRIKAEVMAGLGTSIGPANSAYHHLKGEQVMAEQCLKDPLDRKSTSEEILKHFIETEKAKAIDALALQVANVTRQAPALNDLVQAISSIHLMTPHPTSDHVEKIIDTLQRTQNEQKQELKRFEYTLAAQAAQFTHVESDKQDKQEVQSLIDAALAKQEERHQEETRQLRADFQNLVSKHEVAMQAVRIRVEAVEQAQQRSDEDCMIKLQALEERQDSTLQVIRHDILDLDHTLLELKSSSGDGRQASGNTAGNATSSPKVTTVKKLSLTMEPFVDDDSDSTDSVISDEEYEIMEPAEAVLDSSAASTKTTSSSFSTGHSSTHSPTFDNTGPLAVSPAQLAGLMRAALLLNAECGAELLHHIEEPDLSLESAFPTAMFLRKYKKQAKASKEKGKLLSVEAAWKLLRSVIHEPIQPEMSAAEDRPPLWEGCGPRGIGKDRK